MAMDKDNVIRYILDHWPDDIDKYVGGEDSHTVKLMRIMVAAIISEIVENGVVDIRQLPVQTFGSPSNHTGFGNGVGVGDIR